MGTEKGLFKDIEKYSKLHNEVTEYFANRDNVFNFLWGIAHIACKTFKIELEYPVRAKNEFLYGFADCIIDVIDDSDNHFKILLEFKSSLKDYPETLRQMNIYRTTLKNIDYAFLIVNMGKWFLWNYEQQDDELNEKYDKIYHTLYEQNIILIDFHCIEDEIKGLYYNDYANQINKPFNGKIYISNFFSGKRKSSITGLVQFITKYHNEKKDIDYYNVIIESEIFDPKIKMNITCIFNFMFSPQDWESFYSKYLNHFNESDNRITIEPNIECISNCVILDSQMDIHGPFIYSLQIDEILYYNAFVLRKIIN